jgi:hypothetical protein
VEQSGEGLREQIDSVLVLDGGDYVGAHSRGCGVGVTASWCSGGVGFVGGLRGWEGQVGVVQGRRVDYQVYSTIAIAVVGRRGGHGWGGWGRVVGGKLRERGSSWD